MDFKIMIQSSKFMVPDPNGLSELLTQGALEHASSLLKTANLDFDQILNKMSMALNFAVVEKVDNTAYMNAKTINGQHSVAFLIKLNNENKLSVEGKSTEPSILASLTDEIRDMDL